MLPQKCPINKPRKRTPKKNLEGPVVKACIEYLIEHRDVIYVERRNTGAVQFQNGGFIRFGSKGAADIWCLVKSRVFPFKSDGSIGADLPIQDCEHRFIVHVEIECKRADGKGRQSEAQKKFQEFCDDRGIPYILTTSASYLAEQISAIVLDK